MFSRTRQGIIAGTVSGGIVLIVVVGIAIAVFVTQRNHAASDKAKYTQKLEGVDETLVSIGLYYYIRPGFTTLQLDVKF